MGCLIKVFYPQHSAQILKETTAQRLQMMRCSEMKVLKVWYNNFQSTQNKNMFIVFEYRCEID